MDAYHKLRSDLEVSRQTHSGKTFYVIKDPVSERFFRLREPEYFLAEALDGRTSTEQVLEKFEQRFGLKITPEQLDKFIDALRQKGFLYSKSAEYQLSRASQVESKRSFIDKILYFKLKAFNPDRFLQWLYRWFKFTLSTPAVIISSLIIVVGALQVKASASLMPTNVYQIFSLSSIPLLILSIFMVVSLHELAHSIVCRHYGGKVSEMGFLLLYFQICFYCNLSDSYMFEKKSQRIKTILAGIYFQAFLGAASLLMWRIIKTGNTVSDFLFLTASVAIVTLLFNLNPLLKLDGYYLLVDIVEIPNLRSKAFNYLKQILRHVFIEPVEKLAEYTRRERNIFMVYSVLAILYSLILFFWIGSFLYNLLTDKWGGVGFLLFLSLMVVIFNEPIRNSFRSITSRSERQGVSVPKSIRFYIWMAVLAVIVALLFLFPVDLKINAPMTIEPLEKFTIKRTGTSDLQMIWFKGGLEQKTTSRIFQLSIADFAILDIEPSLTPGTQVDSGDLLLKVSSDFFNSQLEQTQAEIDKALAEYELLLSDPKAAELAKAKAALDEARLKQINIENEYQRAKKMYEKNLISEEEWEIFKTQRSVTNKQTEIAKSEYDLLREGPKAEELLKQDAEIDRLRAKSRYLEKQIEACTIHSPFDGKATLFGQPGEIISVAKNSTVEVRVRIPEDQVDILEVSQDVYARVAGFPRASFQTELTKVIASSHKMDGKNYFVAVGLLSNPSGLLKDGMTGYAKIICGKTSPMGILSRKFVRFFRVEFWSWW